MNKVIDAVRSAHFVSSLLLLCTVITQPVQAQNYDFDALPTKKYQAYPQEIPEKRWVSLFFAASRQYGREEAQAEGWGKRYYSNMIKLNADGEVFGWVRDDDETEKHILIETSMRNCLANSTSYSGLFVEYWQGSSLQRRERYYSSYYYDYVPSLAIKTICEAAIAEYKKRI